MLKAIAECIAEVRDMGVVLEQGVMEFANQALTRKAASVTIFFQRMTLIMKQGGIFDYAPLFIKLLYLAFKHHKLPLTA